jgi:hypothetical protein
VVSDDGPGVDFVLGDDGPEPDEELAEPGPARNPHLRRTLAGAAVLLVAGALIGRHVSTHHSKAAPVASASSSASASASTVPVTPSPAAISRVVALPVLVPVPEGNRSSQNVVALPNCPPNATCDILTAVPRAIRASLRNFFPGARVLYVHTFLVNRAGRFGPDLLARQVRIRDGYHTITVDIRKPTDTDIDLQAESHDGPDTVTKVVTVSMAFTVTVESAEADGRPSVGFADLAAFADEDSLVAPQ